MIVNGGKLKLLDWQLINLAACKVGLFTNNFTIILTSSWTDLVEATFTGYARVSLGALTAPTINGTRAQTIPVTAPIFINGSGSPVTVYGWFLIDVTGSDYLMAAQNLGTTTIPAGQALSLAGVLTDTQE